MAGKKSKQFKATKELVYKISGGVLGTVTDILLFQMFVIGAAVGKGSSPKDTYKIFTEAEEALTELNYQTLKQAFYTLKRRGFVRAAKGKLREYQITREGRQRLESLIPRYNQSRVWDKRIYLITYDIPENRRLDRELLRRFLKKSGCGMLQASVWLTPYNPRKILREFIRDNHIPGAIVISDTGKDGSVGEQSLKKLMAEVYHLDELNEEYQAYTQLYRKYRNSPKHLPAMNRGIFDYLAILGEDPQIPFELLPDDWQGEKAHALFEKFFSVCGRKPN